MLKVTAVFGLLYRVILCKCRLSKWHTRCWIVFICFTEKDFSLRTKHKICLFLFFHMNASLFASLCCRTQDLCLELRVGVLPRLSLYLAHKTLLLRTLSVALGECFLLFDGTELCDPSGHDKPVDQGHSISMQILLPFIHVAEPFELLTFSILLFLRVYRLNIYLLHSQKGLSSLIVWLRRSGHEWLCGIFYKFLRLL